MTRIDAFRASCVKRRRETSRYVASTRDVPATYPRVARPDDTKCLFTGISSQSPLTDSNRRPPPYHEHEEGPTHAGLRGVVRLSSVGGRRVSPRFSPPCDLGATRRKPPSSRAPLVCRRTATLVTTCSGRLRSVSTRDRPGKREARFSYRFCVLSATPYCNKRGKGSKCMLKSLRIT